MEIPLHDVQMDNVKLWAEFSRLIRVIDEDRQISFINLAASGEPSYAVSFVRDTRNSVRRRLGPLDQRPGYPLDKNYYQTVKGMVGALDILDLAEILIIVSECSGGVGLPSLQKADELIHLGPDRFLQELLQKRYARN